MIETILGCVKSRAVVSIPAVHKQPVPSDFGWLLMTKVERMAMGHPTQIFEVTDDIVANVDKDRQIMSHVMPHDEVLDAISLAGMPGATDTVVVVWGEP